MAPTNNKKTKQKDKDLTKTCRGRGKSASLLSLQTIPQLPTWHGGCKPGTASVTLWLLGSPGWGVRSWAVLLTSLEGFGGFCWNLRSAKSANQLQVRWVILTKKWKACPCCAAWAWCCKGWFPAVAQRVGSSAASLPSEGGASQTACVVIMRAYSCPWTKACLLVELM